MTISKKAAQAFEPELLRAFEPVMAEMKIDSEKSKANFYGEAAGSRNDFVKAVRKTVNRSEIDLRSRRKRLLFQLANLHDPEKLPIGCKRLVDSFEFDPAPASETILRAKWTLHYIWRRELPAEAKQRIAQLLLSVASAWPNHGGIYASLLSQRLELDPKNFLGQLVIGILENWPNMAKCGNPDCLVPYFFAKRVTQRYCERGECTRYALRTKSLKHWRKKHGKSTEGGEA